MAKRSGKSGTSKSARPVTPRRQAAIDAYKKEMGRDPPRAMSIKAMTQKVAVEQRHRDFSAKRAAETKRALNPQPVGTPTYEATPNGVSVKSRQGMVYSAETGSWITESAAELRRKPRGPKLEETVPRTRGMPKEQRVEALRRHASGKATWGMSSSERSLAQSQENRLTMGRNRPPTDPRTSFHQIAQTPVPSSSPASPSMTSRIRAAMPSGQTVNTGLMVAGVAAAAGRGFHEAKAEGKTTGEAALAGAKSAAVPAAIAGAPLIAKGATLAAGAAGELAFGGKMVAAAGLEMLGTVSGQIDNAFGLAIGGKMVFGGGAAWGVGKVAQGALTGIAMGAKVVGRVATPAMAAYGAYQGAKEARGKGENMTVGAARGVVRAFDPSTIFMKRGVGERVFDAGVNAASNKMAEFKRANANYAASHMSGHDSDGPYNVGAGKRGFGNPANQAAAQKAKGNRYEGPTG